MHKKVMIFVITEVDIKPEYILEMLFLIFVPSVTPTYKYVITPN